MRVLEGKQEGYVVLLFMPPKVRQTLGAPGEAVGADFKGAQLFLHPETHARARTRKVI